MEIVPIDRIWLLNLYGEHTRLAGYSTKRCFPKKQYPSLEGIKTILARLAESDSKARATIPEDLVVLSFIKELD